MKQKVLPIVSAAFLVIAMSVQFFLSYHHENKELKSNIEYKMELAQKDFVFEVYDMYEATDDIVRFLPEFDSNKDDLFTLMEMVLKHFPDLYSCYIAFLPEYSPKYGKWFVPCAFRAAKDSIILYDVGDKIDFAQRDWYNGALNSDDDGYWSLPYNDGDHADPVFTMSKKAYDENGKLIGVAGSDYTLDWTKRIIEDILPYDDAFCQLFSSNDILIVESGNAADMREMIVFEKVLEPTDMRLVIGVPKHHIRDDIAQTSLITLAVLLSGILIIGILLRHIRKEHDAFTRIETANKVIEKELQIASRIQLGILPKQTANPLTPSSSDPVSVAAKLVPMREVGGDLYDYFRKGDDLFFIIGDVSGKGVSAAIFMSATVNLFRSAVRRLQSPKAIMEEINSLLSANNQNLMFVTAFVGRLHVPTGQLLYCNAGHCVPITVSGSAVNGLPIEPNIPVGYDGKFRFTEQGTMLGQGDTLVLYTDGITEARNAQREMLGFDKWSKIVFRNQHGSADRKKSEVDGLLDEVKAYIGSAEQADDITLMTITKTGIVQPLTLRVECKIDQWPELRTALHNYGLCTGINTRTLKKIEMAIEELVANIVNYSGADWMELTVSSERVSGLADERFVVTLRDNGGKFDPTQQAEVDVDAAIAERQIGGLGIALVRQIADELSYRRVDAVNELTIIKNI